MKRRIIAMLLAIVMLVGNVPVQVFATQSEPEETTACITEGCTYGAGHTGECSTFVACGQEGCTFAAGHEGNCSNYVAPEEPEAEPAADAAVYVTVSDRSELGMAYEEVTVSDINADGKLSVDEALYAAHTVYGKGYTSQEGTVTQLWGVETTNVSFFVNHESVSMDVSADTVSDGDYLVASVDQDAANDYDKYSRFRELEKHVSGGEDFTLTLVDQEEKSLAGMEIGLSNGDGSTTMLGQFTDENGQVTLTLEQEGLYCITAKGTLVEQSINLETGEYNTIQTPIIAPVCVVTVTGNAEPEAVAWSGRAVSVAETSETLSAEVTVTISNDQGGLELVREKVTVTDRDGDNKLTFHDAMVAVHEAQGKEYAAADGNVNTFWDVQGSTNLFFANDRPLVNGVMDPIAEGDTLYAAFLRDDVNYSDWYSFFTEAAVSVEAGKEFTLILQGFSGMSYGEIVPAPLSNIAVSTQENGFDLGKTDDNGAVTIRFDEKGTYVVSADGTVTGADWQGNEMECPIIPPVCIVTVTEPTVPVDKVTLDRETLTITLGEEPVQLVVTVGPENATDKTVSWTTNDASVATAEDGLVTAVGVGTATITATAGSMSATCEVTVEAAPAATSGITIETGHAVEFYTDAYLSQIVLKGVNGTATGSEYKWTVELAEKPEGAITLEMTSSLGNSLTNGKANFYFFANDVKSEQPLTTDPGKVTVVPDWENGTATVTVGIKNAANKVVNDCSYTLELRANDSFVNTAPTLKDSSNTGANASIYLGETYDRLNLQDLFVDADDDPLTYTVQINGQDPVDADANYSFTPEKSVEYTLVFRANDGTADSADCYTVKLTVLENNPPVINGDPVTEATVAQYFTWSIDLSKVFTDQEHRDLTYTVSVNDSAAVATGASYSYTPETAEKHVLVFWATDPAGAQSKEFKVELDVEEVPFIETSCAETGNGKTWLRGIAIQGAGVTTSQWNVESGHDESVTHILNIELDKSTADDALIFLAYQKKYTDQYRIGTVSGPDTVKLENGRASVEVTVSNSSDFFGDPKTYILNFTNKPNTPPAASQTADMVDVQVPGDFTIDLTKIFSDADGDTLLYTVKQGDSQTEEVVENGVFTRNIAIAGQKLFIFTAYDAWNASATHTVFVAGKVTESTYDVQLLIPEGITPSFYITGDFDGENGDTLGSALEAEAGETKDGFRVYTVAVPESTSRISFRGTDTENNNWGGMSVAVVPNMAPVTVIQLNAVIPSKVDGSYVNAQQALFQLVDKDGHYAVSGSDGTDENGILLYRFLVVAWGTEDLANAYTAYGKPLDSLTSQYAETIGSNKTFVKDKPLQTTQLKLTLKSPLTITAPTGAVVQVFQQQRYYNSSEIPVAEKETNDDGTTDWIFVKGSPTYMSYRVSMAGKITKAGYIGDDEITVTWSDNDASPNCVDAYDTSRLYGARGDDSLVLNVNKRNNLVLDQGGTFRLRAYRIWEIINSDTSNVIIQPDMHYSLSGDDILSIVPVTSGNGNGKNNWLDLQATGSGVAYLEVGYDALNIVTGNMSGFGGDEISGFTFNASDKDRIGLVVVQVGNAATDVDFGIRGSAAINGYEAPWDAEFDTLYFTGNSGELTLKPSVGSGSIASVAVSADKGVSWRELTAAGGAYTAEIFPGNNILRLTKADGTAAYQVVRGDRVTVSITGGDGDTIVEAGETFRIQLHGLHNPIGKMSGNYNPGYQAGQHVTYQFNGSTVTTQEVFQYDFVSNAWVDVTIPEDAQDGAEFLLKDGYISFNVMGIAEVNDDTRNHRSLTDDGCTTRASGGSTHQRSILPDITLTVGNRTDGSSVVSALTLDQQELTMTVGDTAQVTATVTPADSVVDWSSDDNSVAMVSNGTVTAYKAGNAIITAKAGGKEAACKVTVEPGLTFDIESENYVTVSFVDDGVRIDSDLASIDEKYKAPLGTIVKATRVPFEPYDTIAAVTLRLLKALNINAFHTGDATSNFYLSKIGNFTIGETTYDSFGEFDAGSGSGWMVTQNGEFINKGASEFAVKNGDVIKWQYTCQLGADIGDTQSQEAVTAVEKLISDIGDVTLDSETAIAKARAAYEDLAPVQQAAVSNYDVLAAAEAALAALKASKEDKTAAQVVVDKIEAIGELKQDRKEAIEEAVTAARAAYDGLTDAQKLLITNSAELEAAEAYLELLNRVPASIADIYTTTGNYLAGKTLGTGSTSGEWAALGLARSGRSVPASYYEAAVAYVKENISNGRLHEVKSTENSRLILALTAIGKDVTDVDGYNLLSGLNDLDYIGRQGVNGFIYALIALDSHDYAPVGITKDALIEAILAKQLSDGGWTLTTSSEVDLTAMAVQALAPYYDDANVKTAVDKALTWLSNVQNQDGSFSTTDGSNAESIAQVIVALTALGIDPDADSRFIKTGITPVQALAQFYVEGGGFEHIEGTGRNDMATEQGYYALAAYARFKAGQTALYDMSDVTIQTSAANQAAANNVIALINDIGTVDLTKGDEIEAARNAYDALTDVQQALVSNYTTLTAAEREYANLVKTAEDETKAEAVEDLIDAIGTVNLSKEDAIEAARNAYNRLTTVQKALVDNYATLTAAEARLAALKKAEADEAAAQSVENLISNIGSNITLGSESKINTARNAYNALTADQKALVSNYQTLLNAEAALNALKSTVSVTFSLLGCYKHGSGETTVHTLAGGNLQTWIAAKTYKVKPGSTVKDLFEQALTAAGLTWKNPTGNYIESITRNGVTIGEFTNGTYSGWMYTLNGKHPGLGVNQQTLVNGDKVVFHYTDDYRKEEGSTSSSTTGTTTGSTTTSGTTNYITTTTTTVNTETAESVDRLIEDIGEEITLESEAKILAARAAYDKLTEAQKKLVEKYDDLVAAEAKLAELKGISGENENAYLVTGDYIQGLGTPGVGAIGGEWMVIGLARSGRPVPSGYYDHVVNYVRENINDKQQLHSAKSSDNSRLILALTAIGKDVTNVDGHDLLQGLKDMDYIQKQGINGPIWALLAFDSGNYPVPEGNVTRDKLIEVILEAQLSDGGWALSGERSDPDMTGMAIQALTPYMESNMDVKKAVEAAIWTLSKMQNDNGSFSSVDGPNSESIAQVIVALAALGIDADTDARFVKNGISVMDALLTYYIPGGGFRHVLDGNLDGMSTEQAYYALVAYNRMKQNQNFLYDMTDVVDAGGDVIMEETTEPREAPTEPVVEEEEDNGNNVVIWTGVMSICAAAIAVLLLNRKKLFGKF